MDKQKSKSFPISKRLVYSQLWFYISPILVPDGGSSLPPSEMPPVPEDPEDRDIQPIPISNDGYVNDPVGSRISFESTSSNYKNPGQLKNRTNVVTSSDRTVSTSPNVLSDDPSVLVHHQQDKEVQSETRNG